MPRSTSGGTFQFEYIICGFEDLRGTAADLRFMERISIENDGFAGGEVEFHPVAGDVEVAFDHHDIPFSFDAAFTLEPSNVVGLEGQVWPFNGHEPLELEDIFADLTLGLEFNGRGLVRGGELSMGRAGG